MGCPTERVTYLQDRLAISHKLACFIDFGVSCYCSTDHHLDTHFFPDIWVMEYFSSISNFEVLPGEGQACSVSLRNEAAKEGFRWHRTA